MWECGWVKGVYLFCWQFGSWIPCQWNIKYVWNIFTPTFNHALRLGVNHGLNEADDERIAALIHQSELSPPAH